MMDNDALGSVVSREITESLNHFDTEYTQDRLDALDYYLGRPFGNEVEGRSSVVSTEVADVVEQIMPSMMRIFTGTDKVVRFAPRTEEDVEKAEQATDYVNFVLQNDNDYYRVLYNFIKDSLLFKIGVIKVSWDETDEIKQEVYEGLRRVSLRCFWPTLTLRLSGRTLRLSLLAILSWGSRRFSAMMSRSVPRPNPVAFAVRMSRRRSSSSIGVQRVLRTQGSSVIAPR